MELSCQICSIPSTMRASPVFCTTQFHHRNVCLASNSDTLVAGNLPSKKENDEIYLVVQRYLVSISGNDGRRVLADAWILDTSQKPYVWQRLNPEGDKPYARMYAAGCARTDGMLLLCGGRNASGTPLADAYGLLLHTNGQWEWTLAPGTSPSPRYQHAATEQDPSFLRRCRHASASVGARIYIYGGLRGDNLDNQIERAYPESVLAEIGIGDIKDLNFLVFEQPHMTILSGHVEGKRIKDGETPPTTRLF